MRQKSQRDWFVLCTKARQELKVLESLSQLGIETYTPTKIVVKRWSNSILEERMLPNPQKIENEIKNKFNIK